MEIVDSLIVAKKQEYSGACLLLVKRYNNIYKTNPIFTEKWLESLYS